MPIPIPELTAAPDTHLTRTAHGWTLMHQGQPLCHERATLADCLAIGARAKLHIPAPVWIANLARFGTLDEARATQLASGELTGAQLAVELKSRRAVQLIIYTGKTVRGYSETRTHYFGSPGNAHSFAADAGAEHFNLYGWNGEHWTTDALPE